MKADANNALYPQLASTYLKNIRVKRDSFYQATPEQPLLPQALEAAKWRAASETALQIPLSQIVLDIAAISLPKCVPECNLLGDYRVRF